MAKKLTFSQVKQMFKAAGFELLSTSYTSSKAPLAFRCKRCGNGGTTRLEYVKAGAGCFNCWEARRGQSQKHSLDFVRDKFAAKRLEILSKIYTDSKTSLDYRCLECYYVGKLRFNDLSNGSGCRQCGIRRRTSLRKLDFEKFKADLQEREIKVLSGEYVNSGTKLKLWCAKCQKIWRATAHDLRSAGAGCPRCGHKRGGLKLAYTTDRVARELAKQFVNPTLSRSQPIPGEPPSPGSSPLPPDRVQKLKVESLRQKPEVRVFSERIRRVLARWRRILPVVHPVLRDCIHAAGRAQSDSGR